MNKKITCTINGKKREIEIDVRMSLLDAIRDIMGLTGCKMGCEVGECGACTVLVDDEPIDSCIYLAIWADGKEIRTIEGVANGRELSEMQQSFVDEGAVQCGFCTPGLVMTATFLDEKNQKMPKEELKRQLSGHLCRCTGYNKISTAVDKVINKQ